MNFTIPKILVVVALLAVGAIAAVVGFLSDYTLVDEKADSVLHNPVGFVLNYVSGDQKTVRFRAELAFEKAQKIDFAFNENIDSFYVDYNGPESKFIVNGLSLRSAGDGQVEFVDYIGSVILSRKLTFSGSAKRVRADAHTLSRDKFVKVSGKDVEFSKVFLSKLNGQSLTLNNVTGTVEIFMDDDSASIPLNNKRFKLSSFDGEIQYYNDYIVIEGAGRLDADVFRAPSE
ncbi:MAG: hypothetical protein U9Q92_06410 [archaeon]|nr:hypothetical protein [archaeon]